MMLNASRLRTIILLGLVFVALGVLGGLTFQANAVKSELRTAESRIIALRTRQMMLQTELETRASQRQLADWNAVDFGYRPPRAAQFLENERQLAALGEARAPGAPDPIRVAAYQDPASLESGEDGERLAIGSAAGEGFMTGKAFAAQPPSLRTDDDPVASALAPYLGGSARIAISARTGVSE